MHRLWGGGVMKNKIILCLLLVLGTVAFAYKPPYGGEKIFSLSSPELLAGGSSSAGGPIFSIRPTSIIDNPAIPALEQRVTLDLGATYLHDGDTEDENGFAFETGLLYPTQWGVGAFLLEGVFVPIQELQVGKSINIKAGFSKDLTDSLCVGVNVGGGGFWGYSSDFSFVADIGAIYKVGDILCFKDLRFAGTLYNIGKTYNDTDVLDLNYEEDASSFPSPLSAKGGASTVIFEVNDFKLGLSADVMFPFFQNFVFDTGVQLRWKDMLTVGSSWTLNAKEKSKEADTTIPSIYVGFKFGVNTTKVAKNNADWAKSEMSVSSAWQRLNGQVDAFSAGALINMGLRDTAAPEIQLGD